MTNMMLAGIALIASLLLSTFAVTVPVVAWCMSIPLVVVLGVVVACGLRDHLRDKDRRPHA